MKVCYILMFCFGVFASFFCFKAEPLSFLSGTQQKAIETQRSVSFMGDTYIFKYGDEIQNEYFSRGENPDGFSSLIAVHIFKNRSEPLFVAQGFYDKLMADNKVVQLAVHRLTKEPTLSFFLTSKQGLELNLWRFYHNSDKDEVIGIQYLKTFKTPLTQLEKQRLKTTTQIISEQFAVLPNIPFIY